MNVLASAKLLKITVYLQQMTIWRNIISFICIQYISAMMKNLLSSLPIVIGLLLLLNCLSVVYANSISTDKSPNQISPFSDTNTSAIVQSLGQSQFSKLEPITNESDLLRPDRVIHAPLLPPISLPSNGNSRSSSPNNNDY
jgi:hypothetical protein